VLELASDYNITSGTIIVEGNITAAEVYNIMGAKIGTYDVTNDYAEILIDRSGIYFVKAIQKDKSTTTTKIFIK